MCYLVHCLLSLKKTEEIFFMRKNRIATTENCCKRSIDALLSICRRLNAGKKANEINLSFKLRRLNRIIRERRDYTTMRVVSETMCEMFSLILENDNLAKLFYENNKNWNS